MHSRHFEIDMFPADLLVIAGDLTRFGTVTEIIALDQWLGRIRHMYDEIIVIAGNHDLAFQKEDQNQNGRNFITNAIYLENDFFEWQSYKIWGSPYSPTYGVGWAFNADRGSDIKKYWDLIPEDTNILITHGPPYGFLDKTEVYFGGMDSVGCEVLADKIKSLKNLKAHIFGHIHDGYGVEEKDGVFYVNASSAQHGYSLIREPLVIELD
jgi:Icc-related predicted phosphoesterase